MNGLFTNKTKDKKINSTFLAKLTERNNSLLGEKNNEKKNFRVR